MNRKWPCSKSPWIFHLNSGSCNGCDIELLNLLSPVYDLERFGCMLVGSPRHADILIITGPLSHQMESRVRLIYDLMPHPKRVVALGVCAISGGAFMGSKSVQKQLDSIIPIDLYIPGCPPHPEAIIEGLLKLISSLETPQTKSLSPKLEKGGIKSE